jgi:hypothetical protein
MAFLVPRTCTKVNGNNDPAQSRPLAEFRDAAAYVLLGDPGAGKTSCFKAEAQATDGVFISARDFLTFDADPAWRDQTLFIDGLDETRAGTSDGRVPLDQIRKKLHALGLPRFRLSCREADWLGDSDRSHLNAVASGSEVVALRLDPLHAGQILEILGHRQDVSNPQEFLDTARNHGVSDLLTNPQTLDLLVKSVGAGRWPENRKDVFELACRELATERNDEHRGATRGAAPPTEALLDAAGRLCAVMLLANEPVVSLTEEAGRLSVRDLIDGENVRAALTTRLFAGQGGMESFAASHRTVAEYLSARHLARLIQDGMPVGRVLALMTGPDGVVVSGLRGLHAWLAVHCAAQRSRLIDADPWGVVLYGDVCGFSTRDKTRVLEGLAGLARDDPGFRRGSRTARPLGALCAPEMEGVFREILTSPLREPAQQALADCVVDAAHYGPPLPAALTDVLLCVVREADRWPAVRYGALQACLHHLPTGHPELARLLDDLGTGRVVDDSDELLGMCLEALYPSYLSTHRVLNFLHVPKQPNLVGSYVLFWTDQIENTVPAQDVPILLDALITRGLPPLPDGEHLFRDMTGKLVARGLNEWGDWIVGDRLYAWLGLGLDEYGHSMLDDDNRRQVQNWLSAHPDRYKEVVACTVRTVWNPERPELLRYSFQVRLYGADLPGDFGCWLLSRADDDPDLQRAAELFDQAVSCLYLEHGHDGLSMDFLEDWVDARPEFRARLERMLYCEIPDWRQQRARCDRQRAEERAERRRARARMFREHVAELQEGAGAPIRLYELAKAYLGLNHGARGETPIDRLKDFLDDDALLVCDALSGLRQAPFRPDLPSVEDIVQLDLDGRQHFFRPPCLVAAQILFAEDALAFLDRPEAVLKRLVAFRLTDGTGGTPQWVTALARARPDLFEEVFTVYATQLFTTPDKHIHGLYALQHDENYADVARRAVPRLLGLLPAAASTPRLDDLESLLKSGLKHVAADEMIARIHERLALDDIDDAQRTYLLAAAVLLDPQAYESTLREFVGQDSARAQHVLAFLLEGNGRRGIGVEVPASVSGVLVELLGSVFPRVPWSSGISWDSPAMEASEFIENVIGRLGADPSESATQQIAVLLNERRLESWWSTLRIAQQAQRMVHREAAYRPPSPAEVQQTLAQRGPANVADLAALTSETLRDLAQEIRHGNADGYKQFWNLDPHARPTEPRVEDACRDTLLERLRDRLRILGIDAQPEGHYADDKRADIRISFGGAAGFNVPVEIKRDRHPDMWRAMHDQLIPQYTRDPGAAGYGIYLVFWFGGAGMPGRPGDGMRPTTACELEHQLCVMLNNAERPLIQVCVFDVAKPVVAGQ